MSLQHVVFCCSGSSGLKFLAAAARSVFESHSRPERLRLSILYQDLGAHDLENLRRSWEPWSERNQVSFHQMSDYLGELALQPNYGYWFRVWAYKVLPEEVEKILYLDYDVLVLQDVTPLWNMELGEHLGAAVEDPQSRRLARALSRRAETLGIRYCENNRYFNSGVLLLNLPRWRELEVGDVLESRFRGHRPHEQFHDQAELNMLFSEDFLPLSPEWNVIETPTYDLTINPELKPEQLEPKILHFAGREKVTGRWRRLFEKDAFYEALDATQWNGWRSPNDQTLSGRLFAAVLEYKYLVLHGAKVKDQKSRLKRLLFGNPVVPLVSLFIPLNRLRLRIRNSTPVGRTKARLRTVLRKAYMELCARCRPLVKLFFRLWPIDNRSEFERAIDAYSRTRSDFVVLQVGANDGFTADPIHRFIMRDGWSGVLLEPQPEVFKQELSRTYHACNALHLVNAAVDKADGVRDLYRLSCSSARWAHGLSTFRRDTLEKLIKVGYVGSRNEADGQRGPVDLQRCIVKESVPTVTFDSLLTEYHMETLDLLQIDCEGYDAEILKMFPFDRVLPRFVRFESQHLSSDQLRELEAMMTNLGYSWQREGYDTFCRLFPVESNI